MASRRKLKKVLQYTTSDLISECLVYDAFHPESNQEKLYGTIQQILDTHSANIGKINSFQEKKDKKAIKSFYKEVINEVNTKMIPLLDELGK